MRFIKNIIIITVFLSLITSCSLLKISPGRRVSKIKFNEKDSNNKSCNFLFSDYKTDVYLDSLRNEFGIDSLVMNSKSDIEKALIILKWTNSRWEHNGMNEPKKSDAISILNEAKEGNKFRCVEFGVVLAEVLKSVGIPARTLGLKTKNVDEIKFGAGHVVTEAYLKDLDKWIFLDGQTNLVPVLNDIPLNGVEFQKAIINNKGSLKFIRYNQTVSKEREMSYIKWVGKYLFYFDASFDNRSDRKKGLIKCNEKSRLMLVPIGEKEPNIFQRKFKMNYLLYTNNYKDFYKTPTIEK